MPNNFVRWEEGGALIHHCPHCQVPLANKRSKLRCLGIHVEWCKKYHCQLFKAGGSASCMGCKGSDKQKYNRHKEIAELLKELRIISKDHQATAPPKTPTQHNFNQAILDGPTSKKDRKEAKRVAKAAERAPCIITTKDIERIRQILGPEEAVDGEFERSLLTDTSMKNNIYYHRGTGNSRETRHRIINQERSRVFKTKLSDEEMDRLLSELRVPSMIQAKAKNERAIMNRLRDKITKDFVHNNNEARDTMARKAGFWRWASRKAYNRLIDNGRIWDWKNGEALAPEVEAEEDDVEEAGAAEHPAAGEEEFNTATNDATHADQPAADNNDVADGDKLVAAIEAVVGDGDGDGDATVDGRSLRIEPSRFGPISSSSVSRDTSISSISRTTRSGTSESSDEGWTTVGKTMSKTDTPKLKLASNGGLKHLGVRTMLRSPHTPGTQRASRTPVSLAGFGLLAIDAGDEDSTEDDEYPPLTPCPKRH